MSMHAQPCRCWQCIDAENRKVSVSVQDVSIMTENAKAERWAPSVEIKMVGAVPCADHAGKKKKKEDDLPTRTIGVLESAKNGLSWYRAMFGSVCSSADDEMESQIDAVIAEIAAQPGPLPTNVPADFLSHRHAWRSAIAQCWHRAGNDADKSYWWHELTAYDRAHAALIGKQVHKAPADTPQDTSEGT